MKTINDWKPETISLLRSLEKAGFTIYSGNNGDETFLRSKFETEDKFLEELLACDEASLYVKDRNGKELWLYLILGNSPGELLSDYTVNKDLDAVSTAHYDEWEGKPQPTCISKY